MTVNLYGIRNCDTVKTARAWLDQAGISYVFHDYKVEGVDPARLARWAQAVGWDALLNRAGTTFRTLADRDRADIDAPKALALMAAHPSLIKRPVADYAGGVLVGFKPDRYAAAFG